jgi:hypothetical protein
LNAMLSDKNSQDHLRNEGVEFVYFSFRWMVRCGPPSRFY